MHEVFTGSVRWFNSAKGYGFIGKTSQTTKWPENGDKDVFVHYTGILDSGYKKLDEGDLVAFSVETNQNNKRMQAIQVVKQSHEVTAN